MFPLTIKRACILFGLVLSMMWGANKVHAISLADIQADPEMLIVAHLGDQTLYAKHNTIGVIPQWHPYYAIGAETYLVDAKLGSIDQYKTNFFYNQSFSGIYFANRVKATYVKPTEEQVMAKVMALKEKDSGIRMYQAQGKSWDLFGNLVKDPLVGHKHTVDVPVSTIYYKGADAIYRFIYGVNFDSVMP